MIKQFKTIVLVLSWSPLFLSGQTLKKPMQDTHYPYPVKMLELPKQLYLAYADEGKGKETLIFIHGLGSYLPAWKKMVDDLRKDHRCIVVDLPGYGKSGQGDWAYDLDFFATCIEQMVQQLNLKKASLIGHSMGGQISMTIALRHPKWLKKLILLAPAGIETFTEQDRKWFETYVTPSILKATSAEQIERNFNVNFYGAKMPQDARFMFEDRLQLRETQAYDQYCTMIPKCVQGMLKQPVFDHLAEIKVPTLVFFGEDDLLIPNRILHPTLSAATIAQQSEKSIPNSQLIMVPQCGHFVLWDAAMTVNASIRKFFKTK